MSIHGPAVRAWRDPYLHVLNATLFAAVCAAMSFGCGADQNEEIVNNLIQAGFPADDIMIVDGLVYVGRDAHVTLEASREMIQVSGDQR